MSRSFFLGVMLGLSPTGIAHAEIIVTVTDPWSPPPAMLGDYIMRPFPPDDRPLFEYVSSVSGPTGDVKIEPPRQHRRVGPGFGWYEWGHGYTGGDVYYNPDGDAALTLPPSTGAIIFYASANLSAIITATADDGTSLTQRAYFADSAVGWGFYATDDSELRTISLSTDPDRDYAVGQFLIAPVPEPATVWLVALGSSVAVRHKRSAAS